MNLRCLVIFVAVISFASAGNILFLVPFNGPSHWLFLSHFIRELLNRGHHVTAVTGIKYGESLHLNYTEVLIDPPYDFNKKRKSYQEWSQLNVSKKGSVYSCHVTRA